MKAPKEYCNRIKAIYGYRHLKKDDKQFFDRFGNRRYTIDRKSFCHDDRKLNSYDAPFSCSSIYSNNLVRLNVDDDTYKIVIHAYNRVSNVYHTIEFMRVLLDSDDDEDSVVVSDLFAVDDSLIFSKDNIDSISPDARFDNEQVAWMIGKILLKVFKENHDLYKDRSNSITEVMLEILLFKDRPESIKNDEIDDYFKDYNFRIHHIPIDTIQNSTNEHNTYYYKYPCSLIQS